MVRRNPKSPREYWKAFVAGGGGTLTPTTSAQLSLVHGQAASVASIAIQMIGMGVDPNIATVAAAYQYNLAARLLRTIQSVPPEAAAKLFTDCMDGLLGGRGEEEGHQPEKMDLSDEFVGAPEGPSTMARVSQESPNPTPMTTDGLIAEGEAAKEVADEGTAPSVGDFRIRQYDGEPR